MSNNPQYPGLQPIRPPPGPPIPGSMEPQRSFAPPPPLPVQFRPVVPTQQPQQFIAMHPQHYQPVGAGAGAGAGAGVVVGVGVSAGVPVGMPPTNHQPQFPQPIQQFPPRPAQQVQLQLQPQAVPLPVVRPPDSQAPNGYTPSLGGGGIPLSASYTFVPASYGQYQPAASQNQALTGSQSSAERPSITTVSTSAASLQPHPAKDGPIDWIEHTSPNGRRFYYNKKTKVSSWEKPFELMTPLERVDATTNWKEYTSPDGKKYYYNKVTKESKWSIPEQLKLAREQIGKATVNGTCPDALLSSHGQPSATPPVVETRPSADNSSLSGRGEEPSSPVSVTPLVATSTSNLQSEMTSGPSASSSVSPKTGIKVDESEAPVNIVTTSDADAGSDRVTVTDLNMARTPMTDGNNFSARDTTGSADGVPAEDKQDGKIDSVGENINNVASETKSDVASETKADVPSETKADVASEVKADVASETKALEPESLVYANKMEAKDAFKALLESVNVGSDWTWDRAMRVIINDKRYGALKTLGERKQAFNEYLNQRKKQEVEEKRMKQKKAREDFKKMLEESTELTTSTRWSKAVSIFEDDERFKAVERDRDRRDMFDSFLEELTNKERARAQEERKKNIIEYRKFLESCDFIKASTQWRKVQDRLEADERCSRLEKIDRLDIFQDYLHDLEKEEEEQKKIQKEELRKIERKNRDEFRKLMEEHIAAGILTAKTHWRDYHPKVKELPAYLAVASNTSGSTPKDLFEDIAEELEKQYHEDKNRIKDAVKLAKITMLSTTTFEDFKSVISKDISSPPISDSNLKLVFDELLERAREKEEKEAKKRKRLADDFLHLLYSIKDITASSKWEDIGPLIEESQEYRSVGDDNSSKEIFEEYIAQLKEEAKENERRRKEERAKKEKEREEREKKKGKQRREKDGGREREREKEKADSDSMDITETKSSKDNKRSEGDGRKQRRHHQSPDHSSHETDKDRTKKSHGHSDRKKSRRHASGQESDEGRHKRHKREHRSDSHREGGYAEFEDAEHGKDMDRW